MHDRSGQTDRLKTCWYNKTLVVLHYQVCLGSIWTGDQGGLSYGAAIRGFVIRYPGGYLCYEADMSAALKGGELGFPRY